MAGRPGYCCKFFVLHIYETHTHHMHARPSYSSPTLPREQLRRPQESPPRRLRQGLERSVENLGGVVEPVDCDRDRRPRRWWDVGVAVVVGLFMVVGVAGQSSLLLSTVPLTVVDVVAGQSLLLLLWLALASVLGWIFVVGVLGGVERKQHTRCRRWAGGGTGMAIQARGKSVHYITLIGQSQEWTGQARRGNVFHEASQQIK